MNHNLEALKAHILPLSKADNFFVARLEWRLTGMYLSEDFDSCPCGQDIKELCYIKNMATGNETYVGNICVKNFLGIDTGNLFKGLRRIAADYTANANKDLIEHAYQLGYIYENEYIFLLSTMHKRNLSTKQLAWKEKINRRILMRVKVRQNAPSPQNAQSNPAIFTAWSY